MIVTVLGGSSQSTPTLCLALARAATSVRLRLAGRDEVRTAAVARACRLLSHRSTVSIECCAGEPQWSAAIAGSDVIILQIRVGGLAGRAYDEQFPLHSGIPGDEGVGPGGLSAAYRCWPEVAKWLLRIRTLAPRSRIILLTSPGGLLVRLAAETVPELDLAHVCELPVAVLRSLCEAVGESVRDVTFDYEGVNHLGWFFNVRSERGDLLQRYVDGCREARFPDAMLVAQLEAFPLSYLRLLYQQKECTDFQRRDPSCRSADLLTIADRSFEAFQAGGLGKIEAAMAMRPAPWYGEAVVPLLRAWMGDAVDVPIFLTRISRAPDVAERPYRAVGGLLVEAQTQSTPPRAVASLLGALKTYEGLATVAVLDGSEAALVAALSALPWTQTPGSPRHMARQILRNSRNPQRYGHV